MAASLYSSPWFVLWLFNSHLFQWAVARKREARERGCYQGPVLDLEMPMQGPYHYGYKGTESTNRVFISNTLDFVPLYFMPHKVLSRVAENKKLPWQCLHLQVDSKLSLSNPLISTDMYFLRTVIIVALGLLGHPGGKLMHWTRVTEWQAWDYT